MELESYSQLNTELVHLKRLYQMGSYAFSSTQSYISYQINIKKIDGDKPLSNRYFSLENNAKTVRDYLKNHSSEYLRELIFIRIMSALEAFFTDMLRDVFIHTHVPFKKQDSLIEFSVGEILSTSSLDDLQNKILSRDKRRLTSGGLLETEKYYKKIFEIDFSNYGHKYKNIKEYYDRRNLFVHSLGMSENGVRLLAKTDQKYKQDYDTDKRELDVPEDYLISCIDDIKNFTSYIHKEVVLKITKPQWQGKKDLDEQKSKLHLIIETRETGIEEFDPKYKFRIGEKVYTLNNFIEYIDIKEGMVEIKLLGWEGALSRYYRLIKKLKKDNRIGEIKGNFDGREWEK